MKKLLLFFFLIPAFAFGQSTEAQITTDINTNIKPVTYNPTVMANMLNEINISKLSIGDPRNNNVVFAGPDVISGLPTFRPLVGRDFSLTYYSITSGTSNQNLSTIYTDVIESFSTLSLTLQYNALAVPGYQRKIVNSGTTPVTITQAGGISGGPIVFSGSVTIAVGESVTVYEESTTYVVIMHGGSGSGGGTTTNALSIGAELISGGASSFNGSVAKSIAIQPASVTNTMLNGPINLANGGSALSDQTIDYNALFQRRLTLADYDTDSLTRADQSTILQLDNGNILIAFQGYSGSTTDFGSSKINGVVSTDHGLTWSAPTVLIGLIGGDPVYNPSVHKRIDGSVFMIVKSVHSSSTAKFWMVESTDGGITFAGTQTMIYNGTGSDYYSPAANVIFRTHAGRLLYPFGLNTSPGCPYSTPPCTYQGQLLQSDDDGVTWTHNASVAINSPDSLNGESGIFLEKKEANSASYAYDYYWRSRSGYVYSARSTNNGGTFGPYFGIGLPAQNSTSKILYDSVSDMFYAVANKVVASNSSRYILRLFTSRDARTWAPAINIDFVSWSIGSYYFEPTLYIYNGRLGVVYSDYDITTTHSKLYLKSYQISDLASSTVEEYDHLNIKRSFGVGIGPYIGMYNDQVLNTSGYLEFTQSTGNGFNFGARMQTKSLNTNWGYIEAIIHPADVQGKELYLSTDGSTGALTKSLYKIRNGAYSGTVNGTTVWELFPQSMQIPVGTNAQRPGAANTGLVTGAMRYNSDIGATEVYTGSAWFSAASVGYTLGGGGTATALNNFIFNTNDWFNVGGTWTATANTQEHAVFGGSFTSRNTNNDAMRGYVFNPTMTVNAGSPTGQIFTGVKIAPTFVGAPSSHYALELTDNLILSGATAKNIQLFGSTNYLNIAAGSNTFSLLNSGGYGVTQTTTSYQLNSQGGLVLESTANSSLTLNVGAISGTPTVARSFVNWLGPNTGASPYAPTSGTSVLLTIGGNNGNGNFQPSSGNAAHYGVKIEDLISQSGTANGNVTLLSVKTFAGSTVLGNLYPFVSPETTGKNGFGLAAPTATMHVVGTTKLDGDVTMVTAGNRLFVTEGSNGIVGQTTLVSGTKAVTISGLTTSSRCFSALVSQGGTVTTTIGYGCVCTANTVTITALTTAGATDTADTSIINYIILN